MTKNRHRRLRTITSAFALLAFLGTAASAQQRTLLRLEWPVRGPVLDL
jgi:hypothetical protein